MIKLNVIFYFGLFLCLFLFISSSAAISGLVITEIDIPEFHVISTDPPEPLILNCDYEYDFHRQHNGVLKWKRNDILIYQWMINKQKPNALDIFKNAVDITYEASTDPYKKYSSLAIMNPTWNMSGSYECRVSASFDSAAGSGNLTIIDIRNYTLNIDANEKDDDIEISCSAENVYPQPVLKLRLNETSTVFIKNREYSQDNDGYYDAKVDGIIKNDGSIDNLTCIMAFPHTNFEKFQTLEGSSSNRLISATLLLPAMILLIFIFFNK